MKNYYEILQVNKNATQEIIAKVYKVLAKKYHPDANPDNKEEAAEKFKEISEAYEILSNEEKRKDYDIQLDEENSSTNENTISLNDYMSLQNYCKELENELVSYKLGTTANTEQPGQNYHSNEYQHSTKQTYNQYNVSKAQEKAYQDAINKAYHDSYINNLRNLGYRIRYKKTLKEQFKNVLTLVITAIVVFIVFKIIWTVPSLKKWFLGLFKI